MRLRFLLALLLCLLCLPSTGLAKPVMTVGVSLLPQKYFVERIAGETLEVIVMAGAGYNPVTYEPKPKQLASLKEASIYFLAGVPFEKKWVSVFKKNNPNMKLVSMTKNMRLREYRLKASEHHSHVHADQHENIDPHFWLSPAFVKIAAKTILDTLIKEDPQNQELYRNNYITFVNDLDKLDQRVRDKIAKTKHKNFAVFHPSWGYFADAYGLNQVAIEVQNRQSGAKTLNVTINKIRDMNIKVIFVQKQFSETDASMIGRETGARLVQVDPLAENYIGNIDKVSSMFTEALQ
ncbi:metal ABC transporter solute-binding protein, Zn/Mn family [Kaarinaea lacus]